MNEHSHDTEQKRSELDTALEQAAEFIIRRKQQEANAVVAEACKSYQSALEAMGTESPVFSAIRSQVYARIKSITKVTLSTDATTNVVEPLAKAYLHIDNAAPSSDEEASL